MQGTSDSKLAAPRKSRGILGWTGQWEFILKPWKSCTRDLKIDQQNDY